jgi:hypothetical protein
VSLAARVRVDAGRGLLAEADERIDELEDVLDTPVGDYWVSGRQTLTDMLNTPRSTLELVTRHRETLQRVSGRRTFRGIVRWVEAVRPVLLAEHADEMNYAADTMGANGGYHVAADRIVSNGGVRERIVVTATTVSPPPRARGARPRTKGRRRAGTTRRSSRSSPCRISDDEHDLARSGGCLGVEAVA